MQNIANGYIFKSHQPTRPEAHPFRPHHVNKTMLHTLETLHQYGEKHFPELLDNFRKLRPYCTQPDSPEIRFLNTGFRSLKWLIYGIRPHIDSKELITLFHHMLAEAEAYRGEDWLYANVFTFQAAKIYVKRIPKPDFNIADWPTLPVGPYTAIINTSTINIANFVFKDGLADIIIGQAPDQSAVLFAHRFLDYETAGKLDQFYKQLTADGEPWERVNPTVFICGGIKFDQPPSTKSVDEIVNILEGCLS